MSDNTEIQDTENENEWINWIEEAIDKEHLKYYEYKEFNNIQEIGAGVFGKVYRANWKNLNKQFALKSFYNLNNVTIKEIISEVIYYVMHFLFSLIFSLYYIYFNI
jgi:hypothetical protein